MKSGETVHTMVFVPDDTPFAADFLLAQLCLEGQASAIREFQDTYRPIVIAYLRKKGASEGEAEDVTEHLWGDCLTERPNNRPRLATYSGRSSLKSWLYVVALNRWMAQKQKEEKFPRGPDDGLERVPGPPSSESEKPLIELMKNAIEAGFRDCPAEDFVLLQLAHMDSLYLTELADMFKCSKSKIGRDLEDAQKNMCISILRHVRALDPLLELSWEDFVDLCRVATPSCFGTETED